MRTFVFLAVVVAFGSAAWMLFGRFQRYRDGLTADARAREMLDTWDERARHAKRVEQWSKTDKRNDG